MKKYILLLIAACQGMAMMAQTPAYKMKVTLKDGSKLVALTDEVEELTFAKLDKVKADLSQRYVTSTSLGVNIDVEANVSRVKAVCVPASQTISDPKAYIEKNADVDYTGSYKKAWDFLTPETDYVVYALAYDTNGLPSEVSQLALKTGKAADDPFTVETTTTATKVNYSVTPKSSENKYYTICTGVDYYQGWCDENGGAGDVLQHFIAMWKWIASNYADTWQNEMWLESYTGTTSDTQGHLMWNADQVVISFGMNMEGELVTPIQVDKVKTKAPTPSSNQIALELQTNEWGGYRANVVVKATPSNNDSYFVTIQPASWVEKYSTDEALLKALCYEASNITPSNMARTKDTDDANGVWEFTPKNGGEKYYVIAVGLEEDAPTTKAYKLEFTLAKGDS